MFLQKGNQEAELTFQRDDACNQDSNEQKYGTAKLEAQTNAETQHSNEKTRRLFGIDTFGIDT